MNWPANVLKTLARGMAVLVPSCKEAARLQSKALDHSLPLIRRIGLGVHLLLCKWCRRYGRQIRLLHDATHEHPDELTESSQQRLTPEAKERLKRSLEIRRG